MEKIRIDRPYPRHWTMPCARGVGDTVYWIHENVTTSSESLRWAYETLHTEYGLNFGNTQVEMYMWYAYQLSREHVMLDPFSDMVAAVDFQE